MLKSDFADDTLEYFSLKINDFGYSREFIFLANVTSLIPFNSFGKLCLGFNIPSPLPIN